MDYRNNVIDLASCCLGRKYVWGCNGSEEFDCSGFTWYIYKELFSIDIEKNGYGISGTTKQMTSDIGILREYIEDDRNKEKYIANINKGDLLFFHKESLEDNKPLISNKYPGDVGIYMGDNKFIHADSDAGCIIISELDDKWAKILVGSKDIITDIKNNY